MNYFYGVTQYCNALIKKKTFSSTDRVVQPIFMRSYFVKWFQYCPSQKHWHNVNFGSFISDTLRLQCWCPAHSHTLSFSPAHKHVLYKCVGARGGWQWRVTCSWRPISPLWWRNSFPCVWSLQGLTTWRDHLSSPFPLLSPASTDLLTSAGVCQPLLPTPRTPNR